MADTSHLRTYTRDPAAISAIGVSLTVRIHLDQAQFLKTYSQKHQVNVSWVVRDLVRKMMLDQKKSELISTPNRNTTRRVKAIKSSRTKRG